MASAPRIIPVLTDRRPTNLAVGEKHQPTYHLDLVMCVDQASGRILSSDLVAPEEGEAVIGRAAQKALEVIDREAPGAEVTWVVRDEQVAAALRLDLPDASTVRGLGEAFAPWDEAYLSMDYHMGSRSGSLPHLWRGDTTPEEVGELFEAAARFYRQRPWEFLDDTILLAVPDTREGAPAIATVTMGASRIARGLALFDSPEDFTRFMSDESQTGIVYASFENRKKVPHTMEVEAERYGWKTASGAAFPMMMRVGDGQPALRRSEDLRRATIAFRALAGVARIHRQALRQARGGRPQPPGAKPKARPSERPQEP